MAEAQDTPLEMLDGDSSVLPGKREAGASILSSKAMFSQRIVSVDFYTCNPLKDFDSLYSEFRLSEVYRVPVLRIFGSTPQDFCSLFSMELILSKSPIPKSGSIPPLRYRTERGLQKLYLNEGQKTCTHIHGVFPYVTILYDSSIENMERQIALGIDQAVNDFLGAVVKTRFDRNSTPQQHVFKVVKVIGRTFYGYRSKEEVFLRIYFYNPLIIKKVVDLMLNGSILNQKFQPYEAHIPYQLQFMIDFNLYGMNLIHYTNVKFRRKEGLNISTSPVSSLKSSVLSSSGVSKFWELAQLPECMYSPSAIERSSVCELEIDVLASDIIVLSSTSGVKSCNPGIDAIWQDEMERRRKHDENNWSQITIPDSQVRPNNRELFLAESAHRNRLDEKLSTITRRLNQTLNIQSPKSSGDAFLSSQVVSHMPSNSSASNNFMEVDRTEQSDMEDDELFVLLQELQKEKEHLENEADNEKQSDILEDEDEELIDDLDKEPEDNVEEEEENIWEQSFLCNTILDELIAEEAEKENQVNLLSKSSSPQPLDNPESSSLIESPVVSPSEKHIFQGDGQGDSDSSSNDEGSVSTTRKSTRLSRGSKVKVNRAAMMAPAIVPETSSKATSVSTTSDRISRKIAALRFSGSTSINDFYPLIVLERCRDPKDPTIPVKSIRNFPEASVNQVSSPMFTRRKSRLTGNTSSTHQTKVSKTKTCKQKAIASAEDSSARLEKSKSVTKKKRNVVPTTKTLSLKVRKRKTIIKNDELQSKSLAVKDEIKTDILAHSPKEDTSENILSDKTVDINPSSENCDIEYAEVDIEEASAASQSNNAVEDMLALPKSFVDSECQTDDVNSTDIGIGTEPLKNREIGIQTEEFPFTGPLCRCQCVYVEHSTMKDESTDIQTDFKPEMKNKHFQTEFSDIMWKSKKFPTSPASTKSSTTTSSVSITSSSGSPVTGSLKNLPQHTSRKITSPKKHHSSSRKKSPNSPSCKPTTTSTSLNVSSPIKKSHVPVVAYKSFRKQRLYQKSKPHNTSIGSRLEKEKESAETAEDMSVNSIYEYSSPLLNKSVTLNESPRKPHVSLFDLKRSVSRSKIKARRMLKNAAILKANIKAPDVYQQEFEPMKQPPSYKSVSKWSETEELASKFKDSEAPKKQNSIVKVTDTRSDMSSDEEVIEEVRRCFGENVSDNDDDTDSWKNNSFAISNPSINKSSVAIISCDNNAPLIMTLKSILKIDRNRRFGERAKRKIRWEDESTCKRFRKEEAQPKTIGNPDSQENSEHQKAANISELDGPSPKNNFGFEHDMSNLQDAKALHQHQYLTTWSVEVHCDVRDDLLPDPKIDPIVGIFIFISNDVPDSYRKPKQVFKCLLTHQHIRESDTANYEYYANENELLNAFLRLYNEWDPDMLIGYEIEQLSWGYIIDRALQLGRDMTQLLSRLLPKKKTWNQEKKDETWNGAICGRIVLNLWKLLRHEITVQSYTYENAAYHILHRKVHRFSHRMLADLWNVPDGRTRVLEYYAERVEGVIEIMETLDLINRTSELARLFGIQFYEVFSRGSQFRVESMMIRTARPSNFIAISPGVDQRARMRAPEFLPLILEPRSNFYTDPVAVLDFQSLYPSMIIAYNYDYATVLGRVEHLGAEGRYKLGCLDTECSPFDLLLLRDNIHISPAGVAFVDSSIRKGILPEMLEQILDTRQMVKRSAKKWKNEGATLQKILDSRQLGLKLIANVTYGYTSANFSGRMPCIEIADSVVSKGRETLQRAIDLVKSNHSRWGGEVIYGDTDSMFIRFPGRNRQEAFRLGQEIADEVTQSNPKPVKLKLEKIYQPCILQSKKRYVGYSYETSDQKEPKYDAKGIETVRRDGCPAVKKILEKSLHILFTTNDPVKVQNFVELQFKKLFTGRVSMKEYTFAREFRGRSGYKPGACVPSLEIAKKATERDPRAEPLTKQRVPYVVIYGKPTLPLIQLVRTPLEFMGDYTMRLNAHYYIEKVIIPALNRCLAHAKLDASKWYKNLPRKYLRNILEENTIGQGTLDDYIDHANCLRCDEKTEKGACKNCDTTVRETSSFLLQMSHDLSRKLETTRQICEACCGDDDKCINMDCPIFPKLLRYEKDEFFNRQVQSKLIQLE